MYLPFSECLILLRPHKAPYLPEVGPGQTYFTVLCASPTALGPIDPSANAGSKTLLRCGSRSSGIHSSGVYEWPVILKKPKNCPVLSIKHREKLMNLAFHFVAFPLFSCLSCAQRIASPPPFSSILAQKPKLRLPWCWPLRYLPTRDRPVGATFFQRITSLESAWNETSIGHWTNALSKMVLKSQQKLTDRNMLSHTTKWFFSLIWMFKLCVCFCKPSTLNLG